MNEPQPTESIGEGWSIGLYDRVYRLNDGEFCVTADLVEKELTKRGKQFCNINIRAILGYFYRLHKGLI